MKNKLMLGLKGALVAVALMAGSTALASTPVNINMPEVIGKVTAINGTTLTVNTHVFTRMNGSPIASVTYTVYAANASVTRNNVASNLSSVLVNDSIVVQGTKSGNTITATSILDNTGLRTTTPPAHPASPLVTGSVTAVNGTTLTVLGLDQVTYTVYAGSATVRENNATSTLAAVTVGDKVMVRATANVSGTTLTAAAITIENVHPAKQGDKPVKNPGLHLGQLFHGFDFWAWIGFHKNK